MKEVKRESYTYATVPLHRDYLQQASLFDTKTYFLLTVTTGQEAFIYDADGWQVYNGRSGRVTAYNFLTGLHMIQIESIEEFDCYSREIVKARG